MSAPSINIRGLKIATRVNPGTRELLGEIVQTLCGGAASNSPCENSFLYIELAADTRRARYISWINLFDIEHASIMQPNQWTSIEPGIPYEERVQWIPYGWSDEKLPNVAYILPDVEAYVRNGAT
jgi:hypothetical protein